MTHRNTTPVPGTDAKPAYLTPVEIGLLGDIGDEEIKIYGRYSPGDLTTVYRIQRSPTSPIKNVTSKVTKLINLNLAERGPKEGASVSAPFPVRLTVAGRIHLEELADAA